MIMTQIIGVTKLKRDKRYSRLEATSTMRRIVTTSTY